MRLGQMSVAPATTASPVPATSRTSSRPIASSSRQPEQSSQLPMCVYSRSTSPASVRGSHPRRPSPPRTSALRGWPTKQLSWEEGPSLLGPALPGHGLMRSDRPRTRDGRSASPPRHHETWSHQQSTDGRETYDRGASSLRIRAEMLSDALLTGSPFRTASRLDLAV